MRTARQTKAAGVLRTAGVGLAPALRTRAVERLEKRPTLRLPPPTTGPGGVQLKAGGVGADDVVVALTAGGELGTVAEWLARNAPADRKAGLRKLFAMHRAGHVGFRAGGPSA